MWGFQTRPLRWTMTQHLVWNSATLNFSGDLLNLSEERAHVCFPPSDSIRTGLLVPWIWNSPCCITAIWWLHPVSPNWRAQWLPFSLSLRETQRWPHKEFSTYGHEDGHTRVAQALGLLILTTYVEELKDPKYVLFVFFHGPWAKINTIWWLTACPREVSCVQGWIPRKDGMSPWWWWCEWLVSHWLKVLVWGLAHCPAFSQP